MWREHEWSNKRLEKGREAGLFCARTGRGGGCAGARGCGGCDGGRGGVRIRLERRGRVGVVRCRGGERRRDALALDVRGELAVVGRKAEEQVRVEVHR